MNLNKYKKRTKKKIFHATLKQDFRFWKGLSFSKGTTLRLRFINDNKIEVICDTDFNYHLDILPKYKIDQLFTNIQLYKTEIWYSN
jgi:hypothetical protein